jgi:hypothetical protein
MARLLRRLLLLAILCAATAAAVRALRSQRQAALGGDGPAAPAWPPLSDTNGAKPAAAPSTPAPRKSTPAPPKSDWVEPADGACPDGYPVKVTQSGTFHVPGGQFYDRSAAVRCYVSPEAALADGYKAAKR